MGRNPGDSRVARRIFLGGMAAACAAAPLVGRSQPRTRSTMLRIGLLGGSSPASEEGRHVWQEFFRRLRELGWVEGENVAVVGRFYGDRLDRLPGLAAELAKDSVDVIVAGAPPSPEAAKRATSTIPIVMALHPDPVAAGLAVSLSRPGGNITGLSMLSRELRAKQLELLKEILPRLKTVAFLRHPDMPLNRADQEATARSLGIDTPVVEARTVAEIQDAFSSALRQRAGALCVLAGSFFFDQRVLIAELAIKNGLPSVYLLREHAEAGGLLTYGLDLRDHYRRAADYVDKILRGARPADLPIEQPSKFELVINLKTAKALGLAIPQSVLLRADQVIGE